MPIHKIVHLKFSGFLSLSFPNLMKILFLLYVMYLQVCMWNVILTTCSIPQIFLCVVPGQPSITSVTPSTSSISLSWSVPGSVVTSYEVMWSSGECPGGVLSSSTTTITGSYTSHTITGLRGGTTYTITVTVTNPAGTNTNSRTGETRERGE